MVDLRQPLYQLRRVGEMSGAENDLPQCRSFGQRLIVTIETLQIRVNKIKRVDHEPCDTFGLSKPCQFASQASAVSNPGHDRNPLERGSDRGSYQLPVFFVA